MVAELGELILAGNIVKLEKLIEELKEHTNLLKWCFKRLIIPFIGFMIILSLMWNVDVMGLMLFSAITFFYGGFLPDIDILVRKTENQYEESLWYEKYMYLSIAPIILYYSLIGRAKPIYSVKSKCFHNVESAFIYSLLIFLISCIFWHEFWMRIIPSATGFMGYLTHLIVDGFIGIANEKRERMYYWFSLKSDAIVFDDNLVMEFYSFPMGFEKPVILQLM
jgi:hypothetical protein